MNYTESHRKIYPKLKAGDLSPEVRNTKVSPNFTWGELLAHRTPKQLIDHYTMSIHNNLIRLATRLEVIRKHLGNRPVQLTSVWRDRATNKAVGGRPSSRHVNGTAADFVVKGLTPQQVQSALEGVQANDGLGYGKTFTHIDIRGYRARWNYD